VRGLWIGLRCRRGGRLWCRGLVICCEVGELAGGRLLVLEGSYVLHGPKLAGADDANLDWLAGRLQLGEFRGEVGHRDVCFWKRYSVETIRSGESSCCET
jgi:hypothetical protein